MNPLFNKFDIYNRIQDQWDKAFWDSDGTMEFIKTVDFDYFITVEDQHMSFVWSLDFCLPERLRDEE